MVALNLRAALFANAQGLQFSRLPILPADGTQSRYEALRQNQTHGVGNLMRFHAEACSRSKVLIAEFVCSVVSTKWPVFAACTAMCATSWSRTSPTRYDLGGLPQQRPQTPREREADGLVDLGLADARDENLDRIFQADDAEPFPVHFLDGRVKGRCLALLERLDRANLFLVALDERRCWFRYHHLFGDLLRHRLERDRSPEEIRALRLRAGDWLGANGELAEAIPQYLAAGGYDRAARLIEGSYVEILSRGGLGQLLAWCREIPDDVTAQRPGLGVVSAWALAWAGRQEATEAVLVSVERGLERHGSARDEPENGALRGDISVIRALLDDLAGNTARAVRLARQADVLLPADHLMGRALVFYILGRAAKYQGDLAEADAIFSEFLRFAVAHDNIWGIAGAVFELAVLRRLQGTLDRCLPLLGEFEVHAERHRARGSAPLAKTFAVAGDLSREQGRLKEALRTVGDAVHQVEGWGIPVDVYTCLYYLARAQRSSGKSEEAMATLAKAQDISRTKLVFTSVTAALDAERVRNWLAVGDLASARAWADRGREGATESPLNRHVDLLSAARVRLASAPSKDEIDGIDETLVLLEELVATARQRSWIGLLIETLLVQAQAKLLRFGPGEALGALDQAVRLAHQGGFFQTIVDEGPRVADLLRAGMAAEAWTDPRLRDYAKRVLEAF